MSKVLSVIWLGIRDSCCCNAENCRLLYCEWMNEIAFYYFDGVQRKAKIWRKKNAFSSQFVDKKK